MGAGIWKTRDRFVMSVFSREGNQSLTEAVKRLEMGESVALLHLLSSNDQTQRGVFPLSLLKRAFHIDFDHGFLYPSWDGSFLGFIIVGIKRPFVLMDTVFLSYLVL